MIIDKPLPEDPTPTDSPPLYETLSAINIGYSSSKRTELSSPPFSPPPIKSPSITASPGCSSSSNKYKGRTTNWFNFTESHITREVRNTVLGLIRDLVQEQYSSFPEATSILQSCADACAAHSLSLSDVLQEKSIENHTPLYWAIVKRLPDEHHQAKDVSGSDLLSAILLYSAPLSPDTTTDVRQACLATCDQRLFQRLRLSPEFAPVSGVDQMLLGGTIPPDNIEVEDVPGDKGEFVVTFEILHFHKRMVVSKEIGLEFIARNRMWRLEFSIAPEHGYHRRCRPGSWCISLYLLESSPPTWIGSRLIIPEAIPPSTDHHSDHVNSSSVSASSPFQLPLIDSKSKPIELNLESKKLLEASRTGRPPNRIIVMLQDSLLGANLQYGKNPYVGLDETLRGRLEARLVKPK